MKVIRIKDGDFVKVVELLAGKEITFEVCFSDNADVQPKQSNEDEDLTRSMAEIETLCNSITANTQQRNTIRKTIDDRKLADFYANQHNLFELQEIIKRLRGRHSKQGATVKAREVNAAKRQAAKVGEVPAETKPVSIPDIARAIKMNDGTVGLIVRILNPTPLQSTNKRVLYPHSVIEMVKIRIAQAEDFRRQRDSLPVLTDTTNFLTLKQLAECFHRDNSYVSSALKYALIAPAGYEYIGVNNRRLLYDESAVNELEKIF